MSSTLYSWLIVLAMALVVIAGNYVINRRQGMRQSENLRETRMWGLGFIVYAVLDYFILVL